VILVDPSSRESIHRPDRAFQGQSDEVNYATPVSARRRIFRRLCKSVGGIQITHVPFSGAGPAIQAVLSGTTQMPSRPAPARRISNPAP